MNNHLHSIISLIVTPFITVLIVSDKTGIYAEYVDCLCYPDNASSPFSRQSVR